MRIDTVVWSVELRENWFFPKFKCKISFFNIWEPKMSQLIVIGSHWGFAGCSLVSHWGSLRVIWWTFGGHSRFLKKLNFDFGNKFDFLICHSVLYKLIVGSHYKYNFTSPILGVYNKLIECSFGNTIPTGVEPRSYDCVIMLGGFAPGHLPLSR